MARSNWGSLPWAYSTVKRHLKRGSDSYTFQALTIDEYIIDSQEQETTVAQEENPCLLALLPAVRVPITSPRPYFLKP
jgi:hypothetical protein